ncbi:TlpA disulfide reductase family protein [Novosphingobium aquae]|uniref:TlpA disulfide reductase family protein n=1 Tax=Novosphingobium aquae TaxID=3133435 RepID=A0ABU8SAS0_9SPHN
MVLGLGISLLLAGCDRQSDEKAQAKAIAACTAIPAKVGEPDCSKQGNELPEFTLVDPVGKKLSMASLKGKPVLINLWATWCAPCVAELPQLDKLAGGKLKVLTVSQDMETGKVADFLTQRGVKNLEPWLDEKNELSTHYQIQTLPTTILYDAEGREVWRVTGPREWDDEATRKLLKPVL